MTQNQRIIDTGGGNNQQNYQLIFLILIRLVRYLEMPIS